MSFAYAALGRLNICMLVYMVACPAALPYVTKGKMNVHSLVHMVTSLRSARSSTWRRALLPSSTGPRAR
eukprot:14403803-Alexandrium_andersonii.AAC.1